MISPSSSDSCKSSCSQVVAGNYDVIVNEPESFKTILTDYLERFKQLESDLLLAQHDNQQQQQEQQQNASTTISNPSRYANEFKLLKEFSKLLKKDKANFQEGEQEYNLRKNRYRDIIPFSHTRVILNGDPQIPGSDYINANYVKGPSGSPRAYIACQGPLGCTLVDFWRMIWECGVSVVIMACNENESNKPKCEVYWPEQLGFSHSYGNIHVTLVKERQICPDFLIRKFSVKLIAQPNPPKQSNSSHQNNFSTNLNGCNNNNHADNMTLKDKSNNNCGLKEQLNSSTGTINDNHIYTTETNGSKLDDDYQSNNQFPESRGVILERTICQFHYTTWPDHGAPDSIQPILDLVQLMRYVQPTEDKPILVHCSAGCGRTGTICCIDYVWGLLKQGKLDSSFDLCNIISEMRQQRMSMVQTLAQYVLCYRAVATLFIKQLKLIDGEVYEIMDLFDSDEDEEAEEDFENDETEELGSVYI